MRASACCSRAVCHRSEEQLDLSEIGILIEQVGGEAVTRSVEAPVLFEVGVPLPARSGGRSQCLD